MKLLSKVEQWMDIVKTQKLSQPIWNAGNLEAKASDANGDLRITENNPDLIHAYRALAVTIPRADVYSLGLFIVEHYGPEKNSYPFDFKTQSHWGGGRP